MTADLETVGCALCGCRETAVWRRCADVEFAGRERFTIARCRQCGLRFLNPRPVGARINRYYPPAYYTHAATPSARAARMYAPVAALVERHGRRGPLLDLGCGDGAFLGLLRARGWADVQGLEPDPQARRIAVQERGLRVTAGRFPEVVPNGSAFATVCLLETIEHLFDPLAALQAVRSLLAPGGRLVVTTPNVDGLEFRLLGARAVSLQVPRHLYFFTPDSFGRMLAAAGLRPVLVRTAGASTGLTRSLWLALRRREASTSGAAPAAIYHPRSWRRRVHEALDLLLLPVSRPAAAIGLGPTLLVVAERPE
jgi:SAM-dependent methyltransferase